MKTLAKWFGATFAALLMGSLIMGQAGTTYQNNTGSPTILRPTVNALSVSPYTATVTDFYMPVTTGSSANFTINLPACTATPTNGFPPNLGQTYLVKKVDTGTKAVILVPSGTDTIDGTNASAQFGGATSSAGTDNKGQNSFVQIMCSSAGAWAVVDANITYQAALTSGTPSTWTVTVPTGSTCNCTDGTTAELIKCAVASTTLTATGPNTVSSIITATCSF